MGFLDFFRKIGGWFKSAAPKFVGTLAGQATQKILPLAVNQIYYYLQKGPLGEVIKTIGPTVAEWAGKYAFDERMRNFGNNVQNTLAGKGIHFGDGIRVGDAFKEGMQNFYSFLKNGGLAPTGHIDVDRSLANGGSGGSPPDSAKQDEMNPERAPHDAIMR